MAEPLRCMGYRVIYLARLRAFCVSVGAGRFSAIFIGPQMRFLPPRMQAALLVHEVGHLRLGHLWKRIRKLWLVFYKPAAVFDVCREQEYEADMFAAQQGYAPELVNFFSLVKAEDDPFHPPPAMRIYRLRAAFNIGG